jgi:diadenylate cyclase
VLLESDVVQALFAYGRRLTGGNYPWWVVAAELLLIGGVIYTVLRSLQGTRGARLLRAVGMILVVSFVIVRLVAQKYAFSRINYLYPYFLSAVFLMTLVAFHPELRRGLIRLGEMWGIPTGIKDAELLVAPLVQAVARMSKNKIGALIALEGRVPIGGLVDTGVRLEARVSAELLETIFWPGSALHDMGVIIRQGALAAAGCQFPLADSDEVDRTLGSRHRAALGLSQECDALVVVVSEETGIISVAHRGRLRRALTPETLHTLLTDALGIKGAAEPEPETAETADAAAPGAPAPHAAAEKRTALLPTGPGD